VSESPPETTLRDAKQVHMVGIGGSGMSALASLLLQMGKQVTGSDVAPGSSATHLQAAGATIFAGHAAGHLGAADYVVRSSAVPLDNPEVVEADWRRLPNRKLAEAVGELMRNRDGVAVAGTHGKTTTTAMIAHVLTECGFDPSYVIGGALTGTKTGGHLGGGDAFVVEADESDGSFLLLQPSAAVVTNVEADHLENHGDLEGIFHAFELFVDRIDQDGLLLTCADDAGARRMADYARGIGRLVRTYGTGEDADVRVSDIATWADSVEFTVSGPGVGSRRVRVGALIGAHMALNAAAALILAEHLGLDVDVAIRSWAAFGGVHRRFESHGEGGGVRVYDDYAHHPTEIAASLSAARLALAGTGRLIAVFQPGTYSRTQTFARQFAKALAIADTAVVMDIFPAREEPIPGVTGATISDLIELPADQVIYEPRYDAVPERIAELARPGDLVLTMGIGNVYLLCDVIRDACARQPDRAHP
jgi:UDP-N-acetylmuramate--alanine ligase